MDRLRSAGIVVASLVAIENDEIVGHIMFSQLPVETAQGIIEAVSLAPMAVHPKCQRRGIGSALVRQGLERCRQRGKSIVVVVGHPHTIHASDSRRNGQGIFTARFVAMRGWLSNWSRERWKTWKGPCDIQKRLVFWIIESQRPDSGTTAACTMLVASSRCSITS